MRFVCKFDNYIHHIQPGATRYEQGAGNQAILVQTAPQLTAEFARGVLSAAEREACRAHFDGRDTSQYAGEQPGAYRNAGVFVATEGSISGGADNMFYDGSQWEFGYSVFDTADPDQCPAPYRAAFEAVLTADQAACDRVSAEMSFLGDKRLRPTTDVRAGDLVCLDTLMVGKTVVEVAGGVTVVDTPTAAAGPRWEPNYPWPAYDQIKGINAWKVIKETAELIGLDLQRLAHFEMEHRNRPSVVGKLLGIPTKDAEALAKVTLAELAAQEQAVAEAPRAPAPPTVTLDPDAPAPRQLAGAPSEAFTEGLNWTPQQVS